MTDLTRKQIAAHDHTKNNGESIPATSLNSNGIAGGKVPTSDGNGGVIWQVGGGGGGVDLSEIVVIPYGPLPTMTFPFTAEGLQAACNICISSEGGLADGGQIFLPPGTISGLDLIVYDYTSIFGSGNESTYLYGRIKVGTSCAMRDFFLVNEGASTDPIYGFYGYTPDGYITDWRNEFSNIKVRVTNTVGKAYCVYNLKESVFNSCYLKAYSEGNNIDSNPFGGTVFPLVEGIPDGWKLNNCNFDGFTHFEAVKFPEIVPEGSFTVVNLIDGKNYHSQDLYDNTPTRHLPLPTPTGMIPVSNGTSWELTPIPEPSSGVNLTVKEVDNLPSVSASTIIFPNGTLTDNGSGVVTYTPPIGTGNGDVVGPASSVDGHLAVFDGVSGKLIKDGGPVPTVGESVFSETLKSLGKTNTSNTSATFVYLQGTVIIYRPIKIASIKWWVRAAGDYTLTIRDPDTDAILATSNTVTCPVGPTEVTFTFSPNVIIKAGLWYFRLTISGTTNVLWCDARTGQPHNFSAFSITGGKYVNAANGILENYAPPMFIEFYDSNG
jgi:hypothetical protein